MKVLCRPSGNIKKVGAVSEVNLSTPVVVGENIEITDMEQNSLNVARVLSVDDGDNGQSLVKLVMIA